jgi:hypothetical protein
MGNPAPYFLKLVCRLMLVGLVAAILFAPLAIWGNWGVLQDVFVVCCLFALGFFIALFFVSPAEVVWEEGPRYQEAQFRVVLTIGAIGTGLLFIFALWSGDWQTLLTWVGLVAALMLPWLAIVGLVALSSRVLQHLGHRRTKGPTVGPDRTGPDAGASR